MRCRHALKMGILSHRFRTSHGVPSGSWRHIPPHCSGKVTPDDSRWRFNILPQSIRRRSFWYCNVKVWWRRPGEELDRCLFRSRKFIVALQSGHGAPLRMNGTPDPVRSGISEGGGGRTRSLATPDPEATRPPWRQGHETELGRLAGAGEKRLIRE